MRLGAESKQGSRQEKWRERSSRTTIEFIVIHSQQTSKLAQAPGQNSIGTGGQYWIGVNTICFKKESSMATRDFVLTDHSATLMEQGQSEDADQLAVLRKAAQEGIADIDAGRFKTFESRQGLRNHLQGMAAKVRTVK
jgi:hypothetical protein